MRVRALLLLLLLLVAAAFVTGWLAVVRVEREKFDRMADSRRAAWQQSVSDYLQESGKRLKTAIDQFALADGASEGLLDNNPRWAEENLDEQMLSGFDASAVWMFRADGTLFHTVANTAREQLVELPVPDASPLAASRSPDPFFYLMEKKEGRAQHYVEVRRGAVHESFDENGDAPAKGMLFVGKVWDAVRLKRLKPFIGHGRVEVLPAGETLAAPQIASTMVFSQDWKDWQGRPLARLVIVNEDATLAELAARGDRLFYWLLLVGAGLGVLLYALLHLAIVRPLRLVIHSLNSENLAPLEPLRTQKTEFGELARLIHDFFRQRAALMHEMHERSAAEKALRESEEMLRHSQKMEAVGRLAGGVAHDFNNLLTAIIGYAGLLQQRFALEPAVRQPAELIHQAGDQAAGLTRQLLAFSRKQLLQPRVIDLNRIVTHLHRLLQRIIGEHVEIRTLTEAPDPRIKADPGQIEQVIVNLGVNGRDAMPRGGQLTIRTGHLTLTEPEAASGLPAGDYVALEVTDTGAGMDAETRARIFEPFFTTKGPGKGTGLGLSTVYGIVRQSHGGIVVESEIGRGSTFRVLLPLTREPLDVVESVVAPPRRGNVTERILVVEDEEIVRDLVCEILRGAGYEVQATDRGREVARLLAEAGGRLDLLISDVVMPEMNGLEVARLVHQMAPGARVLFVSGYSENDMADQGLELLAFQVLQKPFTPDDLARKVRQVLDGPRAPEAATT